jgi:cytochrome oxidase Cu insertion factor (SCO1/SenC/PrrC family)
MWWIVLAFAFAAVYILALALCRVAGDTDRADEEAYRKMKEGTCTSQRKTR